MLPSGVSASQIIIHALLDEANGKVRLFLGKTNSSLCTRAVKICQKFAYHSIKRPHYFFLGGAVLGDNSES